MADRICGGKSNADPLTIENNAEKPCFRLKFILTSDAAGLIPK